jgi:hypothetical protein
MAVAGAVFLLSYTHEVVRITMASFVSPVWCTRAVIGLIVCLFGHGLYAYHFRGPKPAEKNI